MCVCGWWGVTRERTSSRCLATSRWMSGSRPRTVLSLISLVFSATHCSRLAASACVGVGLGWGWGLGVGLGLGFGFGAGVWVWVWVWGWGLGLGLGSG